MRLPGLRHDAGEGSIRVRAKESRDRPSHDVPVEEGRLCRPGVEEHHRDVITEILGKDY